MKRPAEAGRVSPTPKKSPRKSPRFRTPGKSPRSRSPRKSPRGSRADRSLAQSAIIHDVATHSPANSTRAATLWASTTGYNSTGTGAATAHLWLYGTIQPRPTQEVNEDGTHGYYMMEQEFGIFVHWGYDMYGHYPRDPTPIALMENTDRGKSYKTVWYVFYKITLLFLRDPTEHRKVDGGELSFDGQVPARACLGSIRKTT